MTIGATIKKLRREHDMTQEQLADYMNITAPAVSQWECDRSAPDISQLPLLAHIFDTTTDEILGVDLQKNEERITVIIEDAKIFSYNGEYAKSCEILRNGIIQFPKSYRIMTELSEALSCVDLDSYAHMTGTKLTANAISEEVFSLCQKVINECTDNEIRDKAFQTIIYRYKNIGQKDKAAEYAKMMSHMWVSREEMLIGIYGNDSDVKGLHEYISFCTDRIMRCLDILSTKSDYSPDDKIILLRQIIDIANTIYCDGDSNYYAHHLSSAYQTLAEEYAIKADRENTLSALENMCKASILYDTYPDDAVTTSPAVKGECHGRPIPWDENCCAIQSGCLNDEKWYDFIRDEPRFITVLADLKKYAKT